jgi:hypothetical protein
LSLPHGFIYFTPWLLGSIALGLYRLYIMVEVGEETDYLKPMRNKESRKDQSSNSP